MNDKPLPLAVRIALRLALCGSVTWVAWRIAGPAAMVLTAPLYGVALARPLIDLASDLRHGLRVAVWHRVEGRHHTYRGVPVQVLEDETQHRWVRVADVRLILGEGIGSRAGSRAGGGESSRARLHASIHTSDGAFALTYPDGWRLMGRPPQPHLSDTALLAHLAKDASPEALHLRHWVEREIAFPARRARERAAGRGD